MEITNPAELVKILQFAKDEKGGEGPGRYLVRCRIPFEMDAPGGKIAVRRSAEAEAGEARQGFGEGSRASDDGVITGPASSTSVDWYETRMTVDALRSMERQFRNGVDYFPRHHGFFNAVEWDEVIGRTIDAELRRERVAAPADENSGDDHILYVTTKLDMDEEKSQKLVRRIDAGTPPGQSIGGWFTEVSVTYDEDDWPIDIAILDVDLDHLAAVRSPANPDADRIWRAVERKLQLAKRGEDPESVNEELGAEVAPAQEDPPAQEEADPAELASDDPVIERAADLEGPDAETVHPDGAPEQRHVMGLQVEDDRIVITLERSGAEEEDEEDAETEQSTPVPSGTSSEDPPDAGARSSAAEVEIDMDPKELAKLLSDAIGQALDARGVGVASAAPDPVPSPAPAPAPSAAQDNDAGLRQQLEAERAARVAAEARAVAAERVQTAAPARATAQRTEQSAVDPSTVQDTRRRMADYHGLDLRDVAPQALRAVARSYGELDLTPDLVAELDGTTALAQLAKADGSAPKLSELVLERDTALQDVKELRKRSKGELEDTLAEVLRAGFADGNINPRTRPAGAWA